MGLVDLLPLFSSRRGRVHVWCHFVTERERVGYGAWWLKCCSPAEEVSPCLVIFSMEVEGCGGDDLLGRKGQGGHNDWLCCCSLTEGESMCGFLNKGR